MSNPPNQRRCKRMPKAILGINCVIILIDDAQKLVDAFLKVFTLDHRTFTKAEVRELVDGGVLEVLDSLRDNVRDHESLYSHLLE